MFIYTVSVDSTGYSADHNDLLIVAAENDVEASDLAEAWVLERRGFDRVDILHTEAYRYGGSAKVLGQMDTES